MRKIARLERQAVNRLLRPLRLKSFAGASRETMKLTIAWIGKTKNPAIQSLTDDYLKRLRQYADAEGWSLKDEASLSKLCGRAHGSPRRWLVALDSRGKQMSSEELAVYLRHHQERNPLPLVFAIGGADGFTDSLRTQADLLLSLGKMTLAHELARVVLLEQVYRAFTIVKGHPYHLGH
jgi:23S rRNA (pseudouridine1915-N3)-methyltransferase